MTGRVATRALLKGRTNLVAAVAGGLALAAAAGLRVFVPVLAVSIAGYTGHVALTPGTAWLATLPALVAFAVAVVLEVAAYFVPGPGSRARCPRRSPCRGGGILVSASMFVDLPPMLRWALAIVAGGGSAGLVHGATALVRLKSTTLTGGLLNPAVAGSSWVAPCRSRCWRCWSRSSHSSWPSSRGLAVPLEAPTGPRGSGLRMSSAPESGAPDRRAAA